MEGDVQEFTDSLDTTDRLVLLLHWGDGCTTAEISQILEIDGDAVSASMARLRALARTQLRSRTHAEPAVS